MRIVIIQNKETHTGFTVTVTIQRQPGHTRYYRRNSNDAAPIRRLNRVLSSTPPSDELYGSASDNRRLEYSRLSVFTYVLSDADNSPMAYYGPQAWS